MKNFKDVIRVILTVMMVACLSWILVSFFEVAGNNLNPDYTYSSWNFFQIMLNNFS